VKVRTGAGTVKIKELSDLVGVAPRLLRYYEEQGLLLPQRAANGYRDYDDTMVLRVQQIRGLLGAGLTTEIIRDVLPCLSEAASCRYDDPAFVSRIAEERDRLRERVQLLSQNLEALDGYLDTVAKA